MKGRTDTIEEASNRVFDVAIVGGGINGACLYHQLCRRGHRVILLDKGDFGSGTSQASAMMVWGGLLYLGSLDLKAVYNFSRSRDNMISEMADWVSPRSFRFLPAKKGKLSTLPVGAALYLYWLISRFRRDRPKLQKHFHEKDWMVHRGPSFLFEEGQLVQSDARFVLGWIKQNHSSDSVALNHCELVEGSYSNVDKFWTLSAKDQIGVKEMDVRARTVVNCAGVWTDRLNKAFDIQSPNRHFLSKGVFLGLKRRDDWHSAMIMEMGEHNDVITSIPWGPVLLWGPTETTVSTIEEGRSITRADVDFLLEKYNDNHTVSANDEDIVSLRCGIRPLAVKADYEKEEYPLDLSRRHRIAVDQDRPWISVYGSKLTGCEKLASDITRRLETLLPEPSPRFSGNNENQPMENSKSFRFPGLDTPFPDIRWCMDHEYCCSLEDYLRRRTNIAQWVPREGLGEKGEHLPLLRTLSLELANGDAILADQQLNAYREGVENRFDQLIRNHSPAN